MEIKFFKYQGTGNDFVMLDNRQNDISLKQKQIEFLCDRKFGIGADGLILLENHPDFDFKMLYYNSDGRESSMCGNGGRCLTKFAHDLKIIREEYHFIAIDGEHKAKLIGNEISLQMIDVLSIEEIKNDVFLDTGSPHHIVFEKKIGELELVKTAREIRYSDSYKKEGVNVNFVEIDGEASLNMRTYERGVEDETLSCGTGVTAAVLAANYRGLTQSNKVEVNTKGGRLYLSFTELDGVYKDIWLQGPVEFVFEGKIKI